MNAKFFLKTCGWGNAPMGRARFGGRRALIVVGVIGIGLFVWRSFSAGGNAFEPGTDEFAAWAILHPHEANAILERSAQFVEARAAANLAFQNPEVANAIRRQDPEVARREDQVKEEFLNPWRTEQLILSDPQLRQAYDEALRGISQPGRLGEP